MVTRPPPRRRSGRAVRVRREPCALPRGLAADLKEKLCKGENKSAACPLIHPTQQGSRLKFVGNA